MGWKQLIVEEPTVPRALVRRDVVRHMMSGRVHVIELHQYFELSMPVVFKAITNHSGMDQWLTGVRVTILREGTPRPNGVLPNWPANFAAFRKFTTEKEVWPGIGAINNS